MIYYDIKNNTDVKKALCNISGQIYEYKQPMTIVELLAYIGFNVKVILIEYNGELLNKTKWSKLFIKNKDSFEILTIAGGG
jgi:sulfur carrier protein